MNWLSSNEVFTLAFFMGWGFAILVSSVGLRRVAAGAFWFAFFFTITIT